MSGHLKLSDLKGDAESGRIASAREEEERLKRVKELQENIGELEKLIPMHRPQPARPTPSNKLGARKHSSFKAVSTAPSINMTPRGRTMVPVAYPTVQDLSGSVSVASGVRFNNCAVYLLDRSTQPKCTGDQAGSGGGVRSGTVNGEVKPVDGCRSVRVEGKQVVREGDACTMNSGNNPGVYVKVPATSAAPPGSAILTSNPPVQLDSTESSGASDTDNPLGLSYSRTPAEIVAAKLQQESRDGSGPLRLDLAMLQKPTGPSFVARDIATEARNEKARQYTRNSLTTALLGPVFGVPGAATRALGGSESNVALGNEVGAAAMGVAWSMGGAPGRLVPRVEPRIVVVSRSAVAEAKHAGAGVRVAERPQIVLKGRVAQSEQGRGTPTTALEEIQQLPSFLGKTKAEIEGLLRSEGFTSVAAKNGGAVWTKNMPDGNTASVRLDPPTVRDTPKGFADEVAHAHKEIVPSKNIISGNYKPGKDVVTLDDACCMTKDPSRIHIPIN